MTKVDKDRYLQFGKCCWTCENTICVLSQVNGSPPHEAKGGITCGSYTSIHHQYYLEKHGMAQESQIRSLEKSFEEKCKNVERLATELDEYRKKINVMLGEVMKGLKK